MLSWSEQNQKKKKSLRQNPPEYDKGLLWPSRLLTQFILYILGLKNKWRKRWRSIWPIIIKYKPSTVVFVLQRDRLNSVLSLGLEHLQELLDKEQITLDILAEMNHEDLKQIGVTAYGNRHRLIKGVQRISPAVGAVSSAPGSPGGERDEHFICIPFSRTCSTG